MIPSPDDKATPTPSQVDDLDSALDMRRAPAMTVLRRQIAGLNLSADAKALLVDLGAVTIEIGNRVIALGRKILQLGLVFLRSFPTLAFGTIMAVVLTMLVAAVPLIGPPLAVITGPLFLVLAVATATVAEYSAGDLGKRITKFADALAEAINGARA